MNSNHLADLTNALKGDEALVSTLMPILKQAEGGDDAPLKRLIVSVQNEQAPAWLIESLELLLSAKVRRAFLKNL